MGTAYFNYIYVTESLDLIEWEREGGFYEKMGEWMYDLESPHIYQNVHSVVVF